MWIDTLTTAEDIVTPVLDKLSDIDARILISNIKEFGNQQVLANWTRNAPAGTVRDGWHLHEQDRVLINKLADYLPARDKASLMRLTYQELAALQKEALNHHYQLLRKVLNNRFKGRCDGEPVNTELFLTYAGFEEINYTEKNFRAYIAKRSFPVKNLEAFTRIIENEFLEVEEESNDEN